jgi:hypothetical protein
MLAATDDIENLNNIVENELTCRVQSDRANQADGKCLREGLTLIAILVSIPIGDAIV